MRRALGKLSHSIQLPAAYDPHDQTYHKLSKLQKLLRHRVLSSLNTPTYAGYRSNGQSAFASILE